MPAIGSRAAIGWRTLALIRMPGLTWDIARKQAAKSEIEELQRRVQGLQVPA